MPFIVFIYIMLYNHNTRDLLYSFRLPVSGGFWAVIPPQAVWKRNWAGHDPAQSKVAVARIVATIDIVVWAQLLIT